MSTRSLAWLLLITNLPGHNPALRMRTWRGLKAAGAGLLRDGAYLLPHTERSRDIFESHAAVIREAAGTTHLVAFDADSHAQRSDFERLFDRASDYGDLIAKLDAFKRGLAKLSDAEARQRLATLSREADGIVTRDFFPGEPRKQMEGALAEAEAAINRRFAPDEPHSVNRAIKVRVQASYRGRTWATRERLWIDRVASAWLIRRFIDPKAKFLWLKNTKDCPKNVVGFDFDGAEFTHFDARVTFEVLLASFGLEQDPGLARLAALVHHLDVGGIPTAEGPGFAAIMAGARSLQQNDHSLLKAMTPVLDSLYTGYVTRAGAA